MLVKQLWLDCRKKNLEVGSREVTDVLTRDSDTKVYQIASREDIDRLPLRQTHLFVEFPNWVIIPAENIIARYSGTGTKIIVKNNDYGRMRVLGETLERGVDGFLVDNEEGVRNFHSLFRLNRLYQSVGRLD